jgi:hypothetical protein
MEQQREDWETISYLDNEARVKFLKGCYSCDGIKGSYSSIENLKSAWVTQLRKKKVDELRKLAKRLRKEPNKQHSPNGYWKRRNYLYREMERWQITTLGK